MTKHVDKKQPYIPLYIGDWEQDTNCLSLQAEAAWLKIIFKMWKNGKSGKYKTSTNSLQNLWKTDTKGVQNIIFELTLNDVCNFGNHIENGEKTPEDHNIIVFINRRMVKEAEISEIRTKAVQNRYKTDTNDTTNTLHPLDNDIDNNVLNNNINVPFSDFWDLYDKKRGDRQKLEKKWEALNNSDRNKIMKYIPEYKKSQPDKKYRKDPSTFFNNKSWNDEIINSNGSHIKTSDTNNGGGQKGTSEARTEALRKWG